MNWIWIALVGFLIAGSAAWWLARSNSPYWHRALSKERFPWLIRSLLETTKDGSVLLIQHEGSERFLQFVKHDQPAGTTLAFGFPDAPWSRDYFGALTAEFAKLGIDFVVTETDDEPTRRFAEVECKNVEGALEVARIACDVMSLDDSARFSACIQGEIDSARVVEETAKVFRSRGAS